MGNCFLVTVSETSELKNCGKKILGLTWITADGVILLNLQRNYFCVTDRENQYRVLHRLQFTPYLLNKINPQVSAMCTKCKKEVETYYHCLWLCPLISRFWTNVAKELSSILFKTIQIDPGLFLMNIPMRQLPLTTTQMTLRQKLLFLARRCILLQWIKEKPPSVTQWHKETFQVFPMEHLSASLKGNDNVFYQIWQPFLNYLNDDLLGLLQEGCSSFVFTSIR